MQHYSDVEKYFNREGHISVEIAGYPLRLDLANQYERRCALCLLCDVTHPQFDITRFLINHLVKKGDRVLDAGANIGLTALWLLAAGARNVTAVEAFPAFAGRIDALEHPDITCINAALCGEIGEKEMFTSPVYEQGATCDPEIVDRLRWLSEEPPVTISVPALGVDAIGEAFDIWKLDIEGAEIDVIQGASRSLANNPPRAIWAEIDDDKFNVFNGIIKKTHPYVYRAGITTKDHTLAIMEPEAFKEHSGDFHDISPTYIFLREEPHPDDIPRHTCACQEHAEK
ncbi:FkbM family methyltransferase [Enterobacillus tribolii]|uniref:FkbM family methyltransferase n=1 Tax=Enterobacillus tribolii TaxID=1487935 RepID=A0A370Q7Q9_9GAMM|nr:FkbM family methyltransferase [Enterobacillus tribolii]MBW7984878.1 FkbM family methyltransferase [Enterobacillus tribolii]RDK84090.1 FkbM family methyltransferase [Enterobacillus tribolii]